MNRLLFRIILIYLAHMRGTVSNQYEAYVVQEFDRNAYDCGLRELCQITGYVATTGAQPMGSEAATATVYSASDENDIMVLLGTSTVTPQMRADRVLVNFRWQGATSVALVHTSLVTSNRNVSLISSPGKTTRKFLLGSSDLCQLCRSSATVIMDMEVQHQLNLVIPGIGDNMVTSACSGGSPGPCPSSSTAESTTPTSEIVSTASSSSNIPSATSTEIRITSSSTPVTPMDATGAMNSTGASFKQVSSTSALVTATVVVSIIIIASW